LKLIKDQVHDNIVCSRIEFKLFSYHLFNRLHYIIQNSMAYFVYPSNKTSRFIHSLGVCNVSSLIYKNALNNTNKEVVEKFLKEKKTFIESKDVKEKIDKLIKSRYGTNYLRILKKVYDKDEYLNFELLYDVVEDLVGKDFIKYFCLNSFNDKSLNFVNIILFQCLRFFALLHDYGHLPFSHLFEYAIDEVFEEISEIKQLKESKFYKELEKLLEEDDHIHEIIGKKLSILTLREFQTNSKCEDIEKDAIIKIIYEIMIHILNELYKNKESFFYSLYEIVSGKLDADRMDYTIRDLHASGLNHQYDLDRIVKLYCLVEKNDDKLDDKFRFIPSIQSLYDIESLYIDRNNLYKMVINHHKVKKYDYFLQKAIKIILLEEINNHQKTIDNMCNNNNVAINNLLEALCTILELTSLKDSHYDGETDVVLYKFSQLTDYWLLSLLRTQLMESLVKGEINNSFYEIVQEIFSGTKRFKSLFKREFEFEKFWSDLLQEIKKRGFKDLEEEDVLNCLKNEKFEKFFEKESIFIVYTKKPNAPEKLNFIKSNNEVFEYNFKQKVSEYSIKFFVYYDSQKFEKEKVLEKIKVFILEALSKYQKGENDVQSL